MPRATRHHERAPLPGQVALCRQKTAHLLAAENIGEGGVLLRCQELLPERTLVTLRIKLPGHAQGFTVLGRVTRTRLGRDEIHPCGMAVEFLDIRPTHRAWVAGYVERLGGCVTRQAI